LVMNPIELRGEVTYRRTYSRPHDMSDPNSTFEEWPETVDRVTGHQRWLWERQLDRKLNEEEEFELNKFKKLLFSRHSSVSGRTLWLGGTPIAQTREASQFNCSALIQETINDAVDQIWLLMQGCGVGFHPNPGTLNGFSEEIPEIVVIRSERTGKGGKEENTETIINGEWTIQVGDSAEAWSKAFGKLLSGKHRGIERLIFDFSQIRPAGERLQGYGWISSGDASIAAAMPAIADILNKRAGELLDAIDLLDVGNWMGTVLSSRRSAEIAFHRYGDYQWEDFAMAKKDINLTGEFQRYQSNNSLLFYDKPSKLELRGLFEMMIEAGGSEPGFINAQAALKRAPWFKVLNPCAEILLGNKSFCNLVETDLTAFNGRWNDLLDNMYHIARANYRQTCVNLRDGILQDTWHELNEYLRLTGVGVTGIVGWEYVNDPEAWQALRRAAHDGANSMADELGLPRSKAITTIKPSGTLSKLMGTTEGIHKPLGKYIFNNINFGKHDPLLPKLEAAGYKVWPNPADPEGMLVTFPISWDNLEFEDVWSKDKGFLEINTESAIAQLERYKMVMENYVDHNCSITVSYEPSEVPEIVEWLHENWDIYVGVSWLFRVDPLKSAEDIGYPYLPQEVVTEAEFSTYLSYIEPVDFSNTDSFIELKDNGECAGGACPIK
jgi:adenosylcobalamin-dependent ribonucleoside-triphosphate reductase